MLLLFCSGEKISTATWILQLELKFWKKIEFLLEICLHVLPVM